MEPPNGDTTRLSDMVVFRSMCGDHPSITKTELNMKEDRLDEKPSDKDKKEKKEISYAKISPTSSRTDQKSRPISEHALRQIEARRHGRSLDVASRHEDVGMPANRALVQAALGSFRWPPYLVAVWVLVLLLTHVLHCLVTMLERALPALKKFSQYFRTWTEESWKADPEATRRLCPLALGCATGLLYALYFGLYAFYVVALWAIEPLADDERREDETRVTDYVDAVNSKINSSLIK